MSPELERLFHDTVDLEPEARRRYLDHHCRDAALRRQLERLLAADPGAEQFLGAPVAALAGRVEQETPPTAAQRVGPYRIVRQIGRGGMGAVYEGERLDGELRLRVAIKFVPVSLRTDPIIERFRQERQILANLNHPNVARLLDAGTTEDHCPYLVMELIDGVPIDQWCDAKHPSVRDLVELFLPVCAAVSHAHRNLVVHRDLKPPNILVDKQGEPKLLDFGIAKLIDTSQRNKAATLLAHTPEYASPEQIEGRPVTTATDIFSLGCVLYRLLTGRAPKRDLKAAGGAIPLASTFRPELKGDIDNILRRALQPEPERRYGTVHEFAGDLRRFLSYRPVTATPARWDYLLGRFIRRNRWLAVTIAALLISVGTGTGLSLWQAHRAQQRFTEVRDLANQFLFQFDEKIRDIPGTMPARQFVVSTALGYLERLSKDAARDPALRQEVAAAYRKVSEVQSSTTSSSLGDHAGAVRSIARAQELIESLPTAEQPREEYSRILLRAADLDQSTGRLRESLTSASRVQTIADEWLRAEPNNPTALELASSASVLAARALRRLDSPDEARTAIARAVSLDQLALAHNPQSELLNLRLASTLGWRARLHHNAVDQKEAVDILRRLKQNHTVSASLDRGLMVAITRLAALEQGAPALLNLAEAHAIAARRVSIDPHDNRALMDLQSLDSRYGAALLEAGKLDEAERYLKAATNRDILNRDPENPEARLGLAIALGWMGDLDLARHNQTGAVAARYEAMKIYAALLTANPEDTNVLFPFADNQKALVQLTKDRTQLCTYALTKLEKATKSLDLTAAITSLRQACIQ